MKNLSLVINAILAVFIIILFTMYFSLKNSISGSGQANGSVTPKTSAGGQIIRIAYVNADSINANYNLMKDFKTEVQGRQGALQSEYDGKSRKLQQEYMEYQQRAQSGNISQMDAEKAQKDMEAKKGELDALQRQQDELVKEVQDRNQDIQMKVQDYINEYNKTAKYDFVLTYAAQGSPVLFANQSLDITKPIVQGLNKQYSDSIQKAGTKH